jgi:hypothetical protein
VRIGDMIFRKKEDVELQTTVNTDDLDELIEEGEVENVYDQNDKTKE